jgi:hypothetical protein
MSRIIMSIVLGLIYTSSVFGEAVNFTTPNTEVSPGQEIVISLVALPGYAAIEIMLDTIRTSNGGTASNPQLNSKFLFLQSPGEVMGGSSESELITWVGGTSAWNIRNSKNELDLVTGVLYSFTYHVPDLQPSSYINIFVINDAYYEGDVLMYDLTHHQCIGAIIPGSLILNVIPEPCTIVLLSLGGSAILRRRKQEFRVK